MSQLKAIRTKRGVKQRELAERIGVEPATVSRYEKNAEKLTLPLLRRLAEALCCRVSDLAGETELDEVIAPAGEPPIDEALLAGCIEAVEEGLEAMDETRDAASRAQLVLTMYRLAQQRGIRIGDVIRAVRAG